MAKDTRGVTSGGSGRANSVVLVADNDARSLVFMAMILQRLGYPVCTANNAEKALEQAYFSTPSLIITELKLRRMSGFELMHRVRQEPRISAVPVIIMTGEHTLELEKQCRQAGAEGCLMKPVQANELYQTICPIIEPASRRAHIRIQTSLPVIVNDRPLDCVEGECATSLSASGMHIRTLRPYPVNSLVLVHLTLHGQDVTAEARVLYCRASREEASGIPSLGLLFLKTSPQGREIIRRFINDEVSHGLAPGLT